jgi:signal peptidase I
MTCFSVPHHLDHYRIFNISKHLSNMDIQKQIRQFFLPSFTPRFFIRVSLVALVAYLFFGYLCIPLQIKGSSMEPTYHDGSFNFCWRLAYWFSEPQHYDVVLVRFAGSKVMLLKRVVALAGEQVEFRAGKLIVDGQAIEEPYVKYPCTWNLPPRQVGKGHVYVVGDNRNMPLEEHDFGQTSITRLQGKPLW